ncbi:MAG TPA: Na/Pi cotransporter family protein [Anaerolineae bacterium]|nr:Na/Pi cotransporter family protein [Anaerolineae bacterium]
MVSFLQVLGGLALFLFGVRMLSGGMEKLAGDTIQDLLERMTTVRIKAAMFGTVVTAVLQSSSLMMATMIGLINTNLMTLEQAIGMMMGDEIGTTLTAQIVAFDIDNLAYLFVALGFIMIEFVPHRKWQDYGEVVMGFGILFLGMNLMSDALKVLTTIPAVEAWLITMGQNVFAGLLAGIVFTAIVQSSSAVTGLAVAMGISQAITLDGAVAILLGANIGTCATGLIASARLSKAARQASIAQILINVAGVLIFLPFLSPFISLVSRTSSDLPRQIANAHTIFNVAVSVILFPFVAYIARAARWLVPEKEETETKVTAYIDYMQYKIPVVALTEARRELIRMAEVTLQMIEHSRKALIENDGEAALWVLEKEDEFVDPVTDALETFVNGLMRENLSASQHKRCFQLKNLITDVERVGDLTEDLAEAAQNKADNNTVFSSAAMQDLDQLCRHAFDTYSLALQAFQTTDRSLAQRACRMEDEFDRLYLKARQGHVKRLESNICQPEADVIFTETLRNLERISDHADNLGISTIRN